MSNRLALRLLSGTLEGRTVPVGDDGLTLGRRDGNDLVVADASVSGSHARLEWKDGELWVEDLGSTNGTRVGGRKVERMALLEGDELSFGNVRAQVVADTGRAEAPAAAAPEAPAGVPATNPFLEDVDEISLEEPAAMPAAAPAAMPARPAAPESARPTQQKPAAQKSAAPKRAASAPPVDLPDDDATLEVDFEAFERRGKGSKVTTILVAVVLVAGLGVGGWLVFGGGGEGGGGARPAAPVPDIAGNLLGADFSFEAARDAESWTGADEAPALFSRGRGGAISGRAGLAATLEGDDFAIERSQAVKVRPGQTLAASVATEVEGGTFVRSVSSSSEPRAPSSARRCGVRAPRRAARRARARTCPKARPPRAS
ncbi:MAG: FHA domain-containing protein [Planctomycetota bacterium]